jgi:hypothetical protein
MTDPSSKRLQIWKDDLEQPSEESVKTEAKASASEPPQPPPSPEMQLAALRDLLLQPQTTRIEELETVQREQELSSDKLSALLPGAVRQATTDGLGLAEALSPTLSKSFQELVRSDPQALVDVISPVLFPTIRAAIRDAVRAMVQTLNQTLESSMSWQSIAWRWESWRTGRPFAEVVLLHSLVYRVEQVLLVHRQTGLLLQDVSQGVASKNADIISSMMTALQDFARDSFEAGDRDSLREFQVGDTTVLAIQGSQAVLCAVVRGSPPSDLSEKLCETSEEIHARFLGQLRAFNGDNREFEKCHPLLESCLLSAFAPQKASRFARVVARAVTAAILLSICGLLVWSILRGWEYRQQQQQNDVIRQLRPPAGITIRRSGRELVAEGTAPHSWIELAGEQSPFLPHGMQLNTKQVIDRDQAWLDYLARLRSIPGIVVTRDMIRSDGYLLEGLKDPLVDGSAIDPKEFGLRAEQVQMHWTPFESQDANLVEARILQALAIPQGLTMTRLGEQLRIEGVATHAWIESARAKLLALKGGEKVDLSPVVDQDLRDLRQICEQIENLAIAFDGDSVLMLERNVNLLALAAKQAEVAQNQAARLSQSFRLVVVGDGNSIAVAKRRARTIAEQLLKLGVSRDMVVIATRDSLAEESRKPPVNGCRFDVQVGLFDW